jgi:hypothetical protein
MTTAAPDLWNKPERFGNTDTIRTRHYLVNTTSDLEVVSGHQLMVAGEWWIPGWGSVPFCVDARVATPGLEIVDQTTPLGSPWPKEPVKPHVPEKIVYNRKSKLYPGALSIFAALYGWHTPAMYAAFAERDAWCVATGQRTDTGSWTSNFWQWLRHGPLKDRPEWDDVGYAHGDATERLKPMLILIRALHSTLDIL